MVGMVIIAFGIANVVEISAFSRSQASAMKTENRLPPRCYLYHTKPKDLITAASKDATNDPLNVCGYDFCTSGCNARLPGYVRHAKLGTCERYEPCQCENGTPQTDKTKCYGQVNCVKCRSDFELKSGSCVSEAGKDEMALLESMLAVEEHGGKGRCVSEAGKEHVLQLVEQDRRTTSQVFPRFFK